MGHPAARRRTQVLALQSIAVIAALTAASATQTPTEQYTVHPVFEKGTQHTFALSAEMEIAEVGSLIEWKAEWCRKCAELADDGAAKMSATWSGIQVSVDGQEFDAQDQKPPDLDFTVKNDGSVLLAEAGKEYNPFLLLSQLAALWLTPPVFEDKSPGDKWKKALPADTDQERNSLLAGSVTEYELVGLEDVKGSKALRVKFTYKGPGSEYAEPFAAFGSLWLDPKTADLLKSKLEIENMVIQGTTVSGIVSAELKQES
jgi:hypothetical protein